MAGAANTHLTHLEELILTQGESGYSMARAFLLELLQTLKGNSESQIQTSVKWDGAPAIFAGINPENGQFFVGTKSIFNKVPKINYTVEDVRQNHGHAPGLVDKLSKALKYLPQLGIKNILQGDFMFDDGMLDIIDVDGEPHYRFKPNTIVYAVPVNSDIGREIGQSKFGIVFHTTYDSLDSGARFGADVSGLNRPPGVWFDDAFFTDDTGTVTLTEEEESQVVSLVRESDSLNEKINYEGLPLALLNIYINSEIKTGQFLEDPQVSLEGFKSWFAGRIEKRINSLKSDRGRARATQKGEEQIQSFDKQSDDILNLFRVSRLLFEAKNIFIQKYNNAVYNTKHFVDNGSGDLVASNPEGYVAVDHEGNGVKFVDRLEFSRANFMIDKSSKFTNESARLTIQISENRSITRKLSEWLADARAVNHKFEKLPRMVLADILSGVPLVNIVPEDKAEKAIFNTVIEQATKILNLSPFNEEQEDEDEDPVVDSEFGKTIAVVPGAFKPPHNGHLAMVREYASIADEVIVLISRPTRGGRKLPNGKEITAEDSLAIWGLLTKDLSNVKVAISDHASPMTAAYEYVGKDGPLQSGTKVILGASTKGGDAKRWTGAEKYIKDGVELIDPFKSAVQPTARPDGTPYSATDFRNALGDTVGNMAMLSDFIGADNIEELMAILGLSSRETMSEESGAAAVAGGVAAGGGPWVNKKQIKKGNDEEKEQSELKTENKDLVTVDEVMRLIMERGIIR
jgi:cytidyltransferase-like protein